MESTDILFALLRHAVCNQELKEEIKTACTPENLEAVYTLAKKHDLAHLVAHAVEGLDIPECEVLTILKNTKMRAIYRYARMDLEFERICQTLEEAQIPFIPLKGSVLRRYYPQPWMRTSSDIDILVQEEKLEQACSCLVSVLSYENKGRGYHDVALRAPSGILLELHFALIEEIHFPKAQHIVNTVWEYAEPVAGKKYQHQLLGEAFLFHHILHMGQHFHAGGCGIRFIMDYYIISNKMKFNYTRYHMFLAESGLDRLDRGIAELSNVWFAESSHTEITRKIEQFILSGSVFGNLSNNVALKQVQKGGKTGAILAKLFLPYNQLKGLYPAIEKRKWMMPFFQILRWFRLLSPERRKRSGNFLKASLKVSESDISYIGELMAELGL